MPTTMTFAAHGEAIGDAWTALRNNAASAGLGAAVPTCPGWTVRDLVLHVGVVHRWAVSILTGEEFAGEDAVRAEAAQSADLLDWYDDGLVRLLHELGSAPEDLDVFFFLKDAPRPREAWARRQAHELTIHAVDAMAGRMGRLPSASETWISRDLAVDGIDELLRGFLPRRSSTLRHDPEVILDVIPDDADRSWRITIGPDAAVTDVRVAGEAGSDEPVDDRAPDGRAADATVRGGAVPLYLALWNRGDEVTLDGDRSVGDLYHEQARIAWS